MNELHFAGRNIQRKRGGDVKGGEEGDGRRENQREIREKKTDTL